MFDLPEAPYQVKWLGNMAGNMGVFSFSSQEIC
jgi:hypothetical protein